MNVSDLGGMLSLASSQGGGQQNDVQIALLKKAQDLAKQQAQALITAIAQPLPEVGGPPNGFNAYA